MSHWGSHVALSESEITENGSSVVLLLCFLSVWSNSPFRRFSPSPPLLVYNLLFHYHSSIQTLSHTLIVISMLTSPSCSSISVAVDLDPIQVRHERVIIDKHHED